MSIQSYKTEDAVATAKMRAFRLRVWSLRLEEAEDMLKSTDMPISDYQKWIHIRNNAKYRVKSLQE